MSNYKGFCPAPFVSQVVWADGRIGVCCNDVGVKVENIKEEFKSVRRKKMQNSFKNNIVPVNCESCYAKYIASDYGLLTVYYNLYGSKYNETMEIDNPVYLHYSASNKCNLACKMCTSSASDMYGRTYNDLTNKESEIINDPKLYLNYLKGIVDNLEQFTFHGGEPIRDENFPKIIEILLRKKEDIDLTLITNGTSLKTKSGNIIDLLKPFRKLRIMMSLDSTKTVNDYMRTFTDTNVVIKNFNLLAEKLPNAKMTFHTVISNLSLLYLHKLIRFYLDKKNFNRLDEISYFVLDYPAIFRIETLPKPYKIKVRENLLDNVALRNETASSPFKTIFDSMFKEIEERWDSSDNDFLHLWPEFLNQSRRMDSKSLITTDRLSQILTSL